MTKALGFAPRDVDGGVGGDLELIVEGDDPCSLQDLQDLAGRLNEPGVLDDRDGHSSLLAPGYQAEVEEKQLVIKGADGSVSVLGAVGNDLFDIGDAFRDDPEYVRGDIVIRRYEV